MSIDKVMCINIDMNKYIPGIYIDREMMYIYNINNLREKCREIVRERKEKNRKNSTLTTPQTELLERYSYFSEGGVISVTRRIKWIDIYIYI